MSLLCKIFGHNWETYRKDPHKKEIKTGRARVCKRCEKWDWDYK